MWLIFYTPNGILFCPSHHRTQSKRSSTGSGQRGMASVSVMEPFHHLVLRSRHGETIRKFSPMHMRNNMYNITIPIFLGCVQTLQGLSGCTESPKCSNLLQLMWHSLMVSTPSSWRKWASQHLENKHTSNSPCETLRRYTWRSLVLFWLHQPHAFFFS